MGAREEAMWTRASLRFSLGPPKGARIGDATLHSRTGAMTDIHDTAKGSLEDMVCRGSTHITSPRWTLTWSPLLGHPLKGPF